MMANRTLELLWYSRHTFETEHLHKAIYQQWGLLTSEGKIIKNKPEIVALLQALFKPEKVSIIHCPGHKKGEDP